MSYEKRWKEMRRRRVQRMSRRMRKICGGDVIRLFY